jgi:hypothetical protein
MCLPRTYDRSDINRSKFQELEFEIAKLSQIKGIERMSSYPSHDHSSQVCFTLELLRQQIW